MAKLPAISHATVPPFTARVSLAVQVGTSKTKGFTISLQAAVYPGVLAARTPHTTTTTTTTRKQWEMKEVSQVIELEEIIKFLEGKCQALESIHAGQHTRNNNSNGIRKQTEHAYVATCSSCVLCRSNHPLHRCKQFRKASSQQRMNLIKHNQLCFNCLGNSHRTHQNVM